jgi:uncharacterized protein YcbK (DUF882 family)
MRYFDLSEFDSPDLPGSGEEMKSSTLRMLDQARHIAGIPFVITSGYRTPQHNARVGGVRGSSHKSGYAVDIRVRGSKERFAIIDAAIKAGFTRIGVSQNFIHLDNDPQKPTSVLWLY